MMGCPRDTTISYAKGYITRGESSERSGAAVTKRNRGAGTLPSESHWSHLNMTCILRRRGMVSNQGRWVIEAAVSSANRFSHSHYRSEGRQAGRQQAIHTVVADIPYLYPSRIYPERTNGPRAPLCPSPSSSNKVVHRGAVSLVRLTDAL
ncbi:hypothetical protein LX32DRAFT_75762 [Colletotrichum zoysiae]|uniref:Uncharacterized protein n=1 Tax=Colletotrichum zoysiae TaxID=1216348 RepID=A0AAD9HSK7_9PEZI|nr:hypothetical protein LX32DRAFT_75762 [Colletotrichum zoysiae]